MRDVLKKVGIDDDYLDQPHVRIRHVHFISHDGTQCNLAFIINMYDQKLFPYFLFQCFHQDWKRPFRWRKRCPGAEMCCWLTE